VLEGYLDAESRAWNPKGHESVPSQTQ
jgi:hypothetical protein